MNTVPIPGGDVRLVAIANIVAGDQIYLDTGPWVRVTATHPCPGPDACPTGFGMTACRVLSMASIPTEPGEAPEPLGDTHRQVDHTAYVIAGSQQPSADGYTTRAGDWIDVTIRSVLVEDVEDVDLYLGYTPPSGASSADVCLPLDMPGLTVTPTAAARERQCAAAGYAEARRLPVDVIEPGDLVAERVPSFDPTVPEWSTVPKWRRVVARTSCHDEGCRIAEAGGICGGVLEFEGGSRAHVDVAFRPLVRIASTGEVPPIAPTAAQRQEACATVAEFASLSAGAPADLTLGAVVQAVTAAAAATTTGRRETALAEAVALVEELTSWSLAHQGAGVAG